MEQQSDLYCIDDEDLDFVMAKIEGFVTRIKTSRGHDHAAIEGLAFWQKFLASTYLPEHRR